ncbi:hypothetical protein EJ06DRAFT_292720 [Trichodelitschia bisporula]|uniref:Peroxin/Ferlin domain-containing protein n=1 Tax=Trichodelitschia bisporula TaxID=703511 RepID=A0A6G1I652_9PEZI|nr:hypothetical protein EJ06DRAFT_292720 [Trichodelitschia bisporula]
MSLDGLDSRIARHSTNASTVSAGPHISLVDHTKPGEEGGDLHFEPSRTEDADDDADPADSASLQKRRTGGSLRMTIARRHYARSRWQQYGRKSEELTAPEEGEGEGEAEASATADRHDGWGQSRLDRGRKRVKDLVKSDKKVQVSAGGSAEVDILYENQRGFFLFGAPRFSAASLLNFDPAPWVDARFHDSAVTITTAQVPDPSWEWAWRTWYVDMSGDVDEEGWEYSLWFGKSVWHGSHPMFHSFVRRRRWLRKRVKKRGHSRVASEHALNPDYFTIHSRGKSPVGSTSDAPAPSASNAFEPTQWVEDDDVRDVPDIATLMKYLRKATIDREKIVLVERFVAQGGEEIYYLADEMSAIMSLLVFQNSRRQLLTLLMTRFDAAASHRDEHAQRGEAEDAVEKRYIDHLLKSVKAAQDECKRLEYWSDVKRTSRRSESLNGADQGRWRHGCKSGDGTGDYGADESHEQRAEKAKGKGKEDSSASPGSPQQLSSPTELLQKYADELELDGAHEGAEGKGNERKRRIPSPGELSSRLVERVRSFRRERPVEGEDVQVPGQWDESGDAQPGAEDDTKTGGKEEKATDTEGKTETDPETETEVHEGGKTSSREILNVNSGDEERGAGNPDVD